MSPAAAAAVLVLAAAVGWSSRACCAESLSVLAVFSQPLRSHYMAFEPLLAELAGRGHSVVSLSNFPRATPLANLRDVDLASPDRTAAARVSPLTDYDDRPPLLHRLHSYYRHASSADMVDSDCRNLFSNEDARRVRDERVVFDVVIVEQFMSDCGLAYAATHYPGVPVVGVTSHVLLPWSLRKHGLPFYPTADAFYFSTAGVNPDLWSAFEAWLLSLHFNTVVWWQYRSTIASVLDELVPSHGVDAFGLDSALRLTLSYQHFSLTGSRLISPQVVEVGGMHVGTPATLPPDIEEFISSSAEGVVYVSFGSMLRPSTMSAAKLRVFLSVLQSLPQRVVWKFDNASVISDYDSSRLLLRPWLPQLDILCHEKVVGFISHGGMLGTAEAAHCSTPVLAIPFFGDQLANSAGVRDCGLGARLLWQHVTERTLREALAEITSHRRREAARAVSAAWRDRPQSPLQLAAYWTEYTARHPATPPPPHRLPPDLLSYSLFSLLLLSLSLPLYYLAACVLARCRTNTVKLKVQ